MNPNRPTAYAFAIIGLLVFAIFWPNDPTSSTVGIEVWAFLGLVGVALFCARSAAPNPPEPIQPCHFCGGEFKAGRLFRVRLSADPRSQPQPICPHCVGEKRIPSSALFVRVLALCLLFPVLMRADSADVVFTPRSATYGPLTNVLITIRPLSVPSSDGVGEVAVNAITNRTGTSTNWTTNLYTPGTYEISYFSANPAYRTTFTNDFPNTNGTIYSRDFIAASVNVSGLIAYSKAQANLLFPSLAGTNILFVTNNGRVTIHGTAGGGGSSSALLIDPDGEELEFDE